MLFGRQAGERLEPMRVMRGAFSARPFFHAQGDLARHFTVDHAAMIDSIHDSPVRILGKESLHGVLAEHVLPVIIGHFAGWQVHRNRLTNRHQLQGPKARVTHNGLLF